MMTHLLHSILASAFVILPAITDAQTYAPIVSMTVTAPDGSTHEVSAADSSVASVTTNDGTVYEVRPTVMDEPFSKVTVAFFRAPTATLSTTAIGEVIATKGGAAVATKSSPSFKVAIKSIELRTARK
jgi:hypothetical protein